MAVTRAQIEIRKYPVDGYRAVAGVAMEGAVEVLNRNVAVTGIDVRFPGNTVNGNMTVTGVQIESGLLWNLHLDAHTLMKAHVKSPLVGNTDLQIDLVAVLTLGDTRAGVADAVAVGSYTGRDRVAGATRYLDGSVVGLNP